MKPTPLTRVLAAVLAAPLAIAPVAALAEQHTGGDMESGDTMSDDQSGQDTGASAEGGSSESGGSEGAASSEPDRVIATVDDAEIKTSDIEAAVNALPPQMRQQMPTDMLARMAVDQLVLRQMILQEAETENLAEDPEVQELVEANEQRTQEDAMVQIYVQRALEGVVTDESVQAAYDEITSQSDQEVPPLEAVRPQVEQQVRQQRLAEIRDELQQKVDVTYYGPDGEPQDSADGTQGSAGGESAGSDGGEAGSASSDSDDAESGSESAN